MEKKQVTNEMVILIRQLVVQNQLRMAAMILRVYFMREWKVDEDVAAFFMRKYFEKHYAVQVRKFRQRITLQGGESNAQCSGTA